MCTQALSQACWWPAFSAPLVTVTAKADKIADADCLPSCGAGRGPAAHPATGNCSADRWHHPYCPTQILKAYVHTYGLASLLDLCEHRGNRLHPRDAPQLADLGERRKRLERSTNNNEARVQCLPARRRLCWPQEGPLTSLSAFPRSQPVLSAGKKSPQQLVIHGSLFLHAHLFSPSTAFTE